jgi:hypothetical protein
MVGSPGRVHQGGPPGVFTRGVPQDGFRMRDLPKGSSRLSPRVSTGGGLTWLVPQGGYRRRGASVGFPWVGPPGGFQRQSPRRGLPTGFPWGVSYRGVLPENFPKGDPHRWSPRGGPPGWSPSVVLTGVVAKGPQRVVRQGGLLGGAPEGGTPGRLPRGVPQGLPQGGSPRAFHPGVVPEGFPPGASPSGVSQGWSSGGSPKGVPPRGVRQGGSPRGVPQVVSPKWERQAGSPKGSGNGGRPTGYPDLRSQMWVPQSDFPNLVPEVDSPRCLPGGPARVVPQGWSWRVVPPSGRQIGVAYRDTPMCVPKCRPRVVPKLGPPTAMPLRSPLIVSWGGYLEGVHLRAFDWGRWRSPPEWFCRNAYDIRLTSEGVRVNSSHGGRPWRVLPDKASGRCPMYGVPWSGYLGLLLGWEPLNRSFGGCALEVSPRWSPLRRVLCRGPLVFSWQCPMECSFGGNPVCFPSRVLLGVPTWGIAWCGFTGRIPWRGSRARDLKKMGYYRATGNLRWLWQVEHQSQWNINVLCGVTGIHITCPFFTEGNLNGERFAA